MLSGYRLLPRFVRVLFSVIAVCAIPFDSGIYSATETPDAIFDSLYRDIIPVTGRPRPPYLLARYDSGLDTSKIDELLPQPVVDDEGVLYVPEFEFYEGFLDETDWPRAKGVLDAYRVQAVAHQERLEGCYALLKPGGQFEALARQSPQRAAQVSLIQYAFGDGSLVDARTAASASGAESQFSLAEYLAAEASFVDAVKELNAIAGTISLEALDKALSIAIGPLDHSPRSVAELTPSDSVVVRALGMLARLKVDASAADGIRVIGEYYAFFDAEKDDEVTKSVSAYIRIIEQSYKSYTGRTHYNAVVKGIGGVDYQMTEIDPIGNGVINESDDNDDKDEYSNYPIYLYPSSMLLQTNCPEFSAQFSNENTDWQDGGIWTGNSIKLDIFSEYHGTIRIDVHRFDTEPDWKNATLANQLTLANAETETMTVNAGDIRDNNRRPAHRETVCLSTRKPGYYFAVVTAPLAPVARAFKFAVSRQSLYLRTTRNGVFIRAYRRGDGQPVAGADVCLEIAATLPPDDAIIAYKPKNPSAFRAGWMASDDEISSFEGIAIGPDEDPLVSAASALTDWQIGRAAREKFFQEPAVRRITTDDDGCFFVPLAFDAKDTTYRIRAWLPNEGYGEATITKYQPKNPSIGANRQAAIWSDRPIYRPGETARIKGVLRDNDMFELRVPILNAENKVYLVVTGADGILFRGERPLSDSGSFHLDVDIPHLYRSGGCRVLVLKENKLDRMIKGEGEYPGAVYFPFEINEFRLPALIINEPECLNMIYGGSDLTGSIGIKNLIGGAVEGLDVELRFQGKSVSKYTDADGRVEFSFPTDAVFSEQSSNFDIQVIDSAGVSHSRQKQITILHQPFRLDVETKGISEFYGNNVYAGRAYSVTVNASLFSGEPIVGAMVAVTPPGIVVATDANGEAIFHLTAPAQKTSNHSITVSAISGQGAATVTRNINVLEPPKDTSAQIQPGGSTRAVTTKDPYILDTGGNVKIEKLPQRMNSGDPLPLELSVYASDEQPVAVTIFVDNAGLIYHRTLRLKPGKHTVELKSNGDWAPGVHIDAVAIIGGKIYSADKQSIFVKPTERILTIDIQTDKPEYRPGERCRADLKVTDWSGHPKANVELSLGVVDEAVYQIREDPTPDLINYFYTFQRPWDVIAAFETDAARPKPLSLNCWFGAPYAWGYYRTEQAMESPDDALLATRIGLNFIGGVGGYSGKFGQRMGGRRSSALRGGGSLPQNITLRNDFRYTAFWVADALTGEDGLASVSFNLPDNITTWRFTARAITPDTLIGEVRDTRRSLLPLQAELALPRAIRAGDRVVAGIMATNNLGQSRNDVSIEHSGDWGTGKNQLALLDSKPQRVNVPLNPQAVGDMTLRAVVNDAAAGEGDAIEKTIQVLPVGYPVSSVASGALTRLVELPVELGDEIADGSRVIEIRIGSGFAGVIDDALDELINYPYGCVEQTVSRFVPAAIANAAINRIGAKPSRTGQLPDIIRDSYQRLAGHQRQDGSWGWFSSPVGSDQNNDLMTSYVVFGLSQCRDAGYPPPSKMLDYSTEYLYKRLTKDSRCGSEMSYVFGTSRAEIYAIRSLALAYQSPSYAERRRDLQMLLQSETAEEGSIERLSVLDRIILADAYRLLDEKEKATAIFDAALKELPAQPPKSNKNEWSNPRPREWVLTVSEALAVGAIITPDSPRLIPLAQALVAQRTGRGWGDTKTNASAVRGLSALLSKRKDGKDARVTLMGDGKPLSVANVPASNIGAVLLAVNGKDIDSIKRYSLSVAGDPTNMFWSLRATALRKTPRKETLRSSPNAPRIVQTVYRLTPERERLTLGEGNVLTVRRGEPLEVQLTVKCDDSIMAPVLVWPRPCGVELIRMHADPRLPIAHFESSDTELRLFMNYAQSTQVFRFNVRAEATGDVFAPLPELRSMYNDTDDTIATGPARWTITE